MSVKDAGLPNITGSTPYVVTSQTAGSFQGALYSNGDGAKGTTTGSSDQWRILAFNASKSNAIYGNSKTVQPPALQLIPQIKC